jgi:hypothetical protein
LKSSTDLPSILAPAPDPPRCASQRP